MAEHGKSHKKNSRILLFAALALLLLSLGGGYTAAYLKTGTAKLTNLFKSSYVSAEISEQTADMVKSSIKVKNTGNIPAYIRVALVANTLDEDGNISGDLTLPDGWLNTGAWEQAGSYYYCKTKVAAGAFSPELLSNGSTLDYHNAEITVLAEAIQAEPDSAAQEAWGHIPGSGN